MFGGKVQLEAIVSREYDKKLDAQVSDEYCWIL